MYISKEKEHFDFIIATGNKMMRMKMGVKGKKEREKGKKKR